MAPRHWKVHWMDTLVGGPTWRPDLGMQLGVGIAMVTTELHPQELWGIGYNYYDYYPYSFGYINVLYIYMACCDYGTYGTGPANTWLGDQFLMISSSYSGLAPQVDMCEIPGASHRWLDGMSPSESCLWNVISYINCEWQTFHCYL